jgi:YVTN family beta-propeller protein
LVFVIPVGAPTVSLLVRFVHSFARSRSGRLRRGQRIAAAIALTPLLLLGAAAHLQAQPSVTSFAWIGDGSTGLIGIDVKTLESVSVPGLTAPGAVAYSPDGTKLYVAEAGAIAIYRPHIGGAVRLRSFAANLINPKAIVVTADGSTAYVADMDDDKVLVVDLVSEAVTTSITDGELDAPEGLVLSPDGAFFYVSSQYYGIVQFSTVSNLKTGRAPTGAGIYTDIVITPDGSTVFPTTPDIQTVAIIPVMPTVGGPNFHGAPGIYRQIAISPDGVKLFAPVDGTSTLNVIGVASGQTTSVDLTETADRWGIDVTPDGKTVVVIGRSSHHVILVDAATLTVGSVKLDTTVPNAFSGRFLSPSYLVPGSALEITSDGDLAPIGFRDYVTMAGGTLRLLANWTTTKNLSSIQENSFVDTNGFDASIAGTLNGDLTKQGAGTLTLNATDIGSGSLAAEGGVLRIDGNYSGNVRAASGGTVAGSGIIGGAVDVRAGSIVAPGGGSPAILQMGSATVATGSTLRFTLNGHTPGSDYSQLDVYGAATLAGGTLDIVVGFTPAPGDQFTIVTNRASGTFTGLPEGGFLTSGSSSFQITYIGGDGNDIVLTANAGPTLAAIGNLAIDEDAGQQTVNVSIGDDLTPVGGLTVTASSSDTNLVTNGGLMLSGTGATHTLQFAPEADRYGATTITVRVTDGGAVYVERTFVVTVAAVNDAPEIGAIAPQTIDANSPLKPVMFTVTDVDSYPLTVTASSSNQTLVPDANLTIAHCDFCSAPQPVWTIAATPAADQFGTTTITVTASDGDEQVTTTFVLTVTPNSLTYYLAEGATGPFFDTDLLIANPNETPAPVTITFLLENGTSIVDTRTLPATSRTTIHADTIAGLEAANFSTVVVSTFGRPLAVERTMRWDASGYGAHTEKATDGAASTWLFAEGAQGWFSTYLLLANPQSTSNTATVTWLREGEPAVVRSYPLAPASRTTIDASQEPELVNRTFGARIALDQPGVAERSMYFGSDPMWSGGAASAGATAPSTQWFLAEGATGSYFTTFILLANPGEQPADVTLTYLPESGDPVSVTVTLAAGRRMTRNIALEHASLASAAVATSVTATQPIVVERAQYWGSPVWIESHGSMGVTAAGRHWALAEGRVGGDDGAQTYILLANPGSTDANVTLTFLRTDGTTIAKTVTVPAARRVTVGVTGSPESAAPELTAESFGTRIDSTQPIVVERSLYSNANGVVWAAGTNATATALPEPH